MFKKILILNTGGTFNKEYNQLNGKLDVINNSNFINTIFDDIFKTNNKPKIKTLISKDSLDITKKDRQKLLNKIIKAKERKIIIVHGTDTIHKTAKFLNKNVKDKIIVLTGSMQPFSISEIEPTGNLMMSYGFIKNKNKDGIYICMNGLAKKYKNIKKDYENGLFKKVKNV